MTDKKIDIFISYSWDSESHKEWVLKLNNTLQDYEEFNVTMDISRGDGMDISDDRIAWMETQCTTSDFVLVVSTAEYKKKADERVGSGSSGVTIESRYLVERYHQELGVTASSPILLLQREPYSAPEYLLSLPYTDFSDDQLFDQKVQELVDFFRSVLSQVKGRAGNRTIFERRIDFSSSQEVVVACFSNAQPVIVGSDGADFSGANRIKYELWEILPPVNLHILIIFESATIEQTIERIALELEERKIAVRALCMLTERQELSAANQSKISNLIATGDVSFLTINELVRTQARAYDARFSAKRENLLPYFVDQGIHVLTSEGYEREQKTALDTLVGFATSSSDSGAVYLILAKGGDGKSELCTRLHQSITAKLPDRHPLLLSTKDISSDVEKEKFRSMARSTPIESLYDIYRLFSDSVGIHEDHIDRRTFDVNILSGNIVLIIDGLDEIYNFSQDLFDSRKLLSSIRLLNGQLGLSNVILASRSNVFENLDLDRQDLNVFHLLGFDSSEIKKYFHSRYSDAKPLAIRCIDSASDFLQTSKKDTISPFIVDLIAKVYEEKGEIVTLDFDGKTYPSNTSLTDRIVYRVLCREGLRQNLAQRSIDANDIVDAFCSVVAELGVPCSTAAAEDLLSGKYVDHRSQEVLQSLAANPLMDFRYQDTIAFRYDFLNDYFVSIYILRSIAAQNCSDTPLRMYSRYATAASQEYDYVRENLSNNKSSIENVEFCLLLLRDSLNENRKDEERKRKAISFFIHLYGDLLGHGTSEAEYSEKIFQLFADESGKVAENIFVYGNARKIDFSDMRIRNSGFDRYSELSSCNFTQAYFSNCFIVNCGNLRQNETVVKDTFDDSCVKTGTDLYQSVPLKNSEFRRFLHQFLVSGSFRKLQPRQMFFPKGQSSDGTFVRTALSLSILRKNDDDSLEVTRAARPEVSAYLGNDTLTSKLFKIKETIQSVFIST